MVYGRKHSHKLNKDIQLPKSEIRARKEMAGTRQLYR
jgi:hypothetical protein